MDDLIRLFKMSAKVPMLKTIEIKDNSLTFFFGSTKSDIMIVEIGPNGPSRILFPRNLFPRFTGSFTESNIKTSRDEQMLRAFSLLYDEKFYKKMISILNNNDKG